jgi:crotonobetainyl-CoA:carnitine CoA-transferase CaiB-like acyl-CoA transferase
MKEGVRYNVYRAADGHVLFMASEQEFWRNFCEGVGRSDLFERWPGSKYADHARGNLELRAELRAIFEGRTVADWIEFGRKVNTPLAPVNTPQTLADDPQFQDRLPWLPAAELGADMLSTPIKLAEEQLPIPSKAPTVGQHTDAVLTQLLGYDDERVAALRATGALG